MEWDNAVVLSNGTTRDNVIEWDNVGQRGTVAPSNGTTPSHRQTGQCRHAVKRDNLNRTTWDNAIERDNAGQRLRTDEQDNAVEWDNAGQCLRAIERDNAVAPSNETTQLRN